MGCALDISNRVLVNKNLYNYILLLHNRLYIYTTIGSFRFLGSQTPTNYTPRGVGIKRAMHSKIELLRVQVFVRVLRTKQ